MKLKCNNSQAWANISLLFLALSYSLSLSLALALSLVLSLSPLSLLSLCLSLSLSLCPSFPFFLSFISMFCPIHTQLWLCGWHWQILMTDQTVLKKDLRQINNNTEYSGKRFNGFTLLSLSISLLSPPHTYVIQSCDSMDNTVEIQLPNR